MSLRTILVFDWKTGGYSFSMCKSTREKSVDTFIRYLNHFLDNNLKYQLLSLSLLDMKQKNKLQQLSIQVTYLIFMYQHQDLDLEARDLWELD